MSAEARKELEPKIQMQKKNVSQKPQKVNFDLGKRTTITIHEESKQASIFPTKINPSAPISKNLGHLLKYDGSTQEAL